MTFPTEISTVITAIAGGALELLKNIIVAYWPYLIGLGVMIGLGFKFRRIFQLGK